MDLLTAIHPKGVLFLGKCGGLKKSTEIGHFILPIAGIRGEGTGNDYMPPEIPALPSFRLQMAVSYSIKKYERDYWTGAVYTTNRRVWEHDLEFKEYLRKIRVSGIDMGTATLFIVGFANKIPHGALLLVSDMLIKSRNDWGNTTSVLRGGIKTESIVGSRMRLAQTILNGVVIISWWLWVVLEIIFRRIIFHSFNDNELMLRIFGFCQIHGNWISFGLHWRLIVGKEFRRSHGFCCGW